jgi:chorismate dehydratase
MSTLRIGCVPYLNAKPLIAWFHSKACDADAEVTYLVPSELAIGLKDGSLDVALVSIFEIFQRPNLALIPGISISADGHVRSVRLFSTVPFDRIRTVALDTSSLTSTALIRILLAEKHGIAPEYRSHRPDLREMLQTNDAGLIIGDLKLFDSPAPYVMDLGETWKEFTGLPFVYAAWLARNEANTDELSRLLLHAKEWGEARLDPLSLEWAGKMGLPLERVRDYFLNVMKYGLDEQKLEGLNLFHKKCREHGLIS